jgi:endonuclease YncB( thermonuclease family)
VVTDGDTVERRGRWVTVRIFGVSATRAYTTEDGAKEAERRLKASSAARERFFRPRRERRRHGDEREGP